jgi:hypothetical protein
VRRSAARWPGVSAAGAGLAGAGDGPARSLRRPPQFLERVFQLLVHDVGVDLVVLRLAWPSAFCTSRILFVSAVMGRQ